MVGDMSIPADPRYWTRSSSELSKQSAEVFAEAEEYPIILTRRDGEALVLMSQCEADGQARLLELAAQLISAVTDDHGTLAERMAKVFPWMRALSVADCEVCAREILDAARASFATEQPHLALAELASWKETAAAVAAGLGNTDLEWYNEPHLVARP